MDRMTKRFFNLLTFVAIVAMFGAGCAGRVEETPAQKAPAGVITFTEKDIQKGILRGTYVHEGHTIKFEAIRGEKNPPLSKYIDPEAPTYSIDARFCDESGHCFANAAGGHALANSDWIKEIDSEPTQSEAIDNNKALWAFHGDLKLFDKSGLLKDFPDELETLDGLSNMPYPYPLKQSRSEGTPQKGVLAMTATVASYTHLLEIWWKPAVGIAEHSATRSLALDSSSVVRNVIVTSNHGAAAAASGMALSCNRPFYGRPYDLPVKNKCDTPISPAAASMHTSLVGCCSTAYSLLAGGHVCNDDSRIQRDIMIANGPVTASYCSDWMLQGWTPGCS